MGLLIRAVDACDTEKALPTSVRTIQNGDADGLIIHGVPLDFYLHVVGEFDSWSVKLIVVVSEVQTDRWSMFENVYTEPGLGIPSGHRSQPVARADKTIARTAARRAAVRWWSHALSLPIIHSSSIPVCQQLRRHYKVPETDFSEHAVRAAGVGLKLIVCPVRISLPLDNRLSNFASLLCFLVQVREVLALDFMIGGVKLDGEGLIRPAVLMVRTAVNWNGDIALLLDGPRFSSTFFLLCQYAVKNQFSSIA